MERGKILVLEIAIAAATSDYTLDIFGNANEDIIDMRELPTCGSGFYQEAKTMELVMMSLMWCDPAGSEAVKKEAKAGKMREERGEMIEIDRQIGNSLLFPIGYPLFPL